MAIGADAVPIRPKNDGEGVEPSYRESFLRRLGPDLRVVFPELPWPDEVRAAPRTSPDEGRWRRVDALVRALVEYAERKPTVIALHGLDRSDPLSRDCVRHLL